MRILTLQALASMGQPAARAAGRADFNDYAAGILGGAAAASSGDGLPGGGADGVGGRGGSFQMYRVHQAISRDPAAWVQYYNDFTRRECGDEEGGWSACLYGKRHIDFGKMTDVEHSFYMMAEVHRLLMKNQRDHALAFVCQSLKALEQVTLDRGDWALAWSYTNLPTLKSTARTRRGGAHPVEQAAGMAYLKELRALEEWRRDKGGGQGGGGK